MDKGPADRGAGGTAPLAHPGGIPVETSLLHSPPRGSFDRIRSQRKAGNKLYVGKSHFIVAEGFWGSGLGWAHWLPPEQGGAPWLWLW